MPEKLYDMEKEITSLLKNIHGVIFDLDGVLLDSLSIWKELGERYLKTMQKTPEPDLGKILFPMSLEEGAAYLQKNYVDFKTVEEVEADIQRMIRDYYFYEVPLKKGAFDLVREMKNRGLILEAATSSPRSHAEQALSRNRILPCFTRILTTEEVGESKHSPKIYQLAAEDMGLSPAEILVFEDSLYALETAKKAGFHVVGVFDENGEPDQDRLMRESDVYIKNPGDFWGRGTSAFHY